jgi:hypothetical protein
MSRIAVAMNNKTKEVIGIALMSVFVLACIYYFYDAPFLNQYIHHNEVAFQVFIGVFVAVVLLTSKIFDSSLDILDEYTARTVKTSVINIVIWNVFWLCWCCFNLIVLFKYPFTLKLYLFSFLITNGPGALMFVFGISMWLDYQKDWETIKSDLIAQGELEAVEKAYRIPYQSTLYGILTIPLFLIVSGLYYSVFK